MTQRLGLYGGSFDPIHFGHLISARAVAEQFNLEKVILIPAARPPHKGHLKLTSVEHRLAMTRLAVEGDPLFDVSDAETLRPGPSYTIDTIGYFRYQVGPAVELFWIIGADTLPELAQWHRVTDLLAAVRIVAAARPGWRIPDLTQLRSKVGNDAVERLLADCCPTPEIGISSTDIRQRIQSGRSVRYLTPDPVAAYIAANRTYA